MVIRLTGAGTALPGGESDARRIYSAASAQQEEQKMLMLTGISPEQAAVNRERARAMFARLQEEKPVKRVPRLGEIPDFLKPELAELAKKREAIDRLLPSEAVTK